MRIRCENCAVSRILAKHPLNQASPFESFPLHSTFPHSLRIAHHASEGDPQAARRLKLKSRIRRDDTEILGRRKVGEWKRAEGKREGAKEKREPMRCACDREINGATQWLGR
ncbi:hypothetical protein FA13DRAFT_1300169 [Coprinellus micaceus]|uniref:Uncharacterized protein n=1 Tax=Coprinellus micaceus TaxID=71717 RepID=A0A4Y7R5U9_COPMI|nr:hypothetical protein FA13DRAFT_1300169 [Coprinellus micaceus]